MKENQSYWVLAIPTIDRKTNRGKRQANNLAKQLNEFGFSKFAKGIMWKNFPNFEIAKKEITKFFKESIPENSEVTFLYVSDEDLCKKDSFLGKNFPI